MEPKDFDMQQQMNQMMNHKEGCIVDGIHRIPIDCVTRKDFETSIASLRVQLAAQERLIEKLKSKLYDLEHEPRF